MLFRCLLSGKEYSRKACRKKENKFGSKVWAVIVLFAAVMFTGLPNSAGEWEILFGLRIILLLMSFKRNKDILDD